MLYLIYSLMVFDEIYTLFFVADNLACTGKSSRRHSGFSCRA
jgi:hypothetical protein